MTRDLETVQNPIMGKFDSAFIVTSQDAVGAFFGVGRRRAQDWSNEGMPGETGHYDLREIFKWWLENVYKPPKKKAEDRETSAHLEELKKMQLQQKIRANELEYAKEKEVVIPWAHVQTYLDRMCARYRSAGDLLRKHHGPDAQKILHDAIAAVEADLDGMFGNAD